MGYCNINLVLCRTGEQLTKYDFIIFDIYLCQYVVMMMVIFMHNMSVGYRMLLLNFFLN